MPDLVAAEIEKYAHDHSTPESDLLCRLREETHREMDCPEMLVGRSAGDFLRMLVRLCSARRVLEIGMFTGYSALMMAEGLPEDGRLLTCEVDPEAEAIARRYFAKSPHGHKIDIRMGPALQTVAAVRGPFDIVFIDADKENYSHYYEAALALLRPGGLIVADNVLWSGRVLDPADKNSDAIAAFNDRVQADQRVENSCLTVRDGMMLIWKRP